MSGTTRPDSEKSSRELDDVVDRDELRDRYSMLLQEVRVSLPGVQILAAFLLTAPFSQRFDDLDEWGRRAYAVALASSMVATAFLLAPALLHRLGTRTARSARLMWSIRMLVAGLVAVAVAILTALWGVTRFVFGTPTAWAITGPIAGVLVLAWVVLPMTLRPRAGAPAAST